MPHVEARQMNSLQWRFLYFFWVLSTWSLCSAFSPNNDTLHWSRHQQITWNDFVGRPQPGSPHGAMSNVGVLLKHEQQGNQVSFQIEAFFNKRKSWVRDDTRTDDALSHEQGHFDIAEIYARLLRKAISSISSHGSTLVKKAYKEYESANAKLQECQEKYDAETEHHLNKTEQQKWDLWIADQLRQLEAYKSPNPRSGARGLKKDPGARLNR